MSSSIVTVRTIADLRGHVTGWKRDGESVGVVPTMGALHAGHLALVEAAKQRCDRVIVTLFVNPKQFERADDLAAYPRTEEADRQRLAPYGPDVLYAPTGETMYPQSFATTISVGGVSEGLCGAHRPGHFDGVATVVTKLFMQTQADVAFFGEKDYQQLQVIRRMTSDLDIPVEIVGVPTVREADGLALSSRNAYLTAAERGVAPALNRALCRVAEGLVEGQPASKLTADAIEEIRGAGFRDVDYVEVREAGTLRPIERLEGEARVLGAAWLGKARLIDNVPAFPRAAAGGNG